MMNEEKKALGEYLYESLENDAYLKKLETILTEQFGRKQADQPYWISNKQLHDLLRFADLLSKSFNKAGSLDQKLRAMAIMDKLKFLYPEHKAVEFFKRSVEAQYNGKPFITELELAKFNRESEHEEEE